MVTRIFVDDKVANLYAICVILFYLPNFRTPINFCSKFSLSVPKDTLVSLVTLFSI